MKWYPCELEALAIASAVNNFSTYARESIHPLQVLTDSKPCVQAFDKLCKGHFSASARVSTFLSTLSSYNVSVHHTLGKDNPLSDFNSRNPVPCCDQLCQICKFQRHYKLSCRRCHYKRDQPTKPSFAIPQQNCLGIRAIRLFRPSQSLCTPDSRYMTFPENTWSETPPSISQCCISVCPSTLRLDSKPFVTI